MGVQGGVAADFLGGLDPPAGVELLLRRLVSRHDDGGIGSKRGTPSLPRGTAGPAVPARKRQRSCPVRPSPLRARRCPPALTPSAAFRCAGPGAPVNIQRGPECTAGVPRRREDPEGCCSADVRPSCCRGRPQEAKRQHSAYGEHRSWRHLVASLLTRQSLMCV